MFAKQVFSQLRTGFRRDPGRWRCGGVCVGVGGWGTRQRKGRGAEKAKDRKRERGRETEDQERQRSGGEEELRRR